MISYFSLKWHLKLLTKHLKQNCQMQIIIANLHKIIFFWKLETIFILENYNLKKKNVLFHSTFRRMTYFWSIFFFVFFFCCCCCCLFVSVVKMKKIPVIMVLTVVNTWFNYSFENYCWVKNNLFKLFCIMYSSSNKKRNTPIYFNANYPREMKLVPIIMDYCLL